MPHQIAKRKPIEGVNLDTASQYLKPTQARFLQNVERSVNNGPTASGGNEGVLTPVPASRLLTAPALDGGAFTTLRGYEARQTGETYVWAFHNEGAHCIYRINRDLSIQVVYQGRDLELSDDPVHTIRGAALFFVDGRKYLTWVNGKSWQGFLDVETSIATNSFQVPYFQLGEFEQAQYWQLPTRPPMHCIRGAWEVIDPSDDEELAATNRMLDKTWQFRYKYIYTDGRETEWSPISTSFYVERAQGQKDAKGLPRCINLTFSAGHPQVERIVLAYRNCNGSTNQETNPFDFNIFRTIDKYDRCDTDTPFWERGIREDDDQTTYDENTNDFTYRYCGDDECIPVPVSETNRTQNPCPITSYALAAAENSLALSNNIVGYEPVDCDLSGSLAIIVNEEQGTECKVEMVEVKYAVIIHNLLRGVNQMIYTLGNDPEGEQKLFGGLMYRNLTTAYDNPTPYKQTFAGASSGFIGYVEGTDHYGITKQFRHNRSGALPVEEPVLSDFRTSSVRREVSQQLDKGTHWIQYGTIKVIKGTKGFVRLASHLSSSGDNYRDTSTTVIGVWREPRGIGGYTTKTEINGFNTDYYAREIYFDTCNGAVDLTQRPFIVADLTAPAGDFGNNRIAATAVFGYVRDGDDNPVERAEVMPFGSTRQTIGMGGGGNISSYFTDHNGFYFSSWAMQNIQVGANSLGVKIYVEGANCTRVLGNESTIASGGGAMPNEAYSRDLVIDRVPDYETRYYATVRLRVRDCRGVAMPGVPLVVSGSKAALTSSGGLAAARIRNRMFSFGQPFQERAVLMQGDTGFTICDTSCVTCMPDFLVDLPACLSNGFTFDIRDASGANTIVRVDPFFDISKGLKTGGRYSFAPIFHDATGRHTFIPRNPVTVDLPTIQQKGSFTFSRLDWRFDVSGLPEWVSYMSLARTDNLRFGPFIQWVVDRVTFVDAGGGEAAPGAADKIRLSIQSLVDHNLSNLAANTTYQWVKGDRVSIIADHEGEIFPASGGNIDFLIEGAVTIKVDEDDDSKDRSGYELVIPFDNRIYEKLKPGALIEITREAECETEQPYFEICDVIDVVNGRPVQVEGTITSFDTYQLRRRIRYDEERKIFPFPFEHHSPGDMWGDNCDDRGRVFFKNPWEQQEHRIQTTYLSDAILENGNRNGLSTFRSERVKNWKSQKRGAITATFSLDRGIKIICEHGNFIAALGDNLLRINQQGVAVVSPADQILVEAGQNTVYGLAYEDSEATVFGEDFCGWVDRYRKAVILDDFNRPRNVCLDRCSGYFAQKIQYLTTYNKTREGFNRIRMRMGYDPVGQDVLLSFQATGWADGYIANREDVAHSRNETMCFSLSDGALSFKSFTPEAFATLRDTERGDVFFSFRQGRPWSHKERTMQRYNEFFGVPCDQVIAVLINDNPDKVKTFLAMQQQSVVKYFCPLVEAEGTDTRTGRTYLMQSEVPPASLDFKEGKHGASFLFNKLTPGVNMPLYNGERLRGYFCKVVLVRDSSQNDHRILRDDAKRIRYNELDSILFTYAYSEQSAFNS